MFVRTDNYNSFHSLKPIFFKLHVLYLHSMSHGGRSVTYYLNGPLKLRPCKRRTVSQFCVLQNTQHGQFQSYQNDQNNWKFINCNFFAKLKENISKTFLALKCSFLHSFVLCFEAFLKYFFGVQHLATFIFLFLYNEPGLGVEIDPGMVLTPLPSSIGDRTRNLLIVSRVLYCQTTAFA